MNRNVIPNYLLKMFNQKIEFLKQIKTLILDNYIIEIELK